MRTREWLAITTMLWVCPARAPSAAQTPQLQLAATYSTGLPGDNAEVISIRSDGIAVASNTAGSVDVLDLSNPFAPRRLIRVPVDTTTGTPNSAAIHPQLDYFLQSPGGRGKSAECPLSVCSVARCSIPLPWAFSRTPWSFRQMALFAVITNEAEGSGAGQNGGEGSLSVVDLGASHAAGRLVVRHVALPAIVGLPGVSAGRTDDLAVLPIDNFPRRPSQRTSPSARTAALPTSRCRRTTRCSAWTCRRATCRRLGWVDDTRGRLDQRRRVLPDRTACGIPRTRRHCGGRDRPFLHHGRRGRYA